MAHSAFNTLQLMLIKLLLSVTNNIKILPLLTSYAWRALLLYISLDLNIILLHKLWINFWWGLLLLLERKVNLRLYRRRTNFKCASLIHWILLKWFVWGLCYLCKNLVHFHFNLSFFIFLSVGFINICNNWFVFYIL